MTFLVTLLCLLELVHQVRGLCELAIAVNRLNFTAAVNWQVPLFLIETAQPLISLRELNRVEPI